MKKMVLIGAALFLTVAFGLPLLNAQQQGGPSQGWQCPWMSQGGGMMGQGGGMHHGMGCCMTGPGTQFNQGQPLSKDQAQQMLDNYLASRNNPNLKIGLVADKGNVFEATITTKDGSLVETIQVDKNTGWFRNVS